MSRLMTTNKTACAPSEDWDQPGHPPSLIRVFAVHMKTACSLSYPMIERTAKTDQTGRMPRLIWVFTGRTCHFVGSVVTRWLKFYLGLPEMRPFFIFSPVLSLVVSLTWKIKTGVGRNTFLSSSSLLHHSIYLWFICFTWWSIDELENLHANRTTVCFEPW